MNGLTDRILLFRIQRLHDQRAFGALYDKYAGRIARYLSLKIGDQRIIEELLNDVFFKAWKYLIEEEEVEYLQALLFRIARNGIADHYRAQKLNIVALDENIEAGNIAADEHIEKDLQRSFDAEIIRTALGKLRESYREAIVLRYFEEISISEIAEALGRTPGTIRVLVHRAVRALEDVIKDTNLRK